MSISNGTHRIVHLRPEAERELGFAQARRIGDDLFVAGITSLADGFEVLHPDDMAAQVGEVYRALVDLLAAEGFAVADLVEERVFVTDMAGFVAANSVRKAILAGALPATTAVEIGALVLPGLMIEVAAFARRGSPAGAS